MDRRPVPIHLYGRWRAAERTAGDGEETGERDRPSLEQRQPFLSVRVAAWEEFECGLELSRGERGLLPHDEAAGQGAAGPVGVSGLDYCGGNERADCVDGCAGDWVG